MTEKADHLIERAAALLRSANTARPPERSDSVVDVEHGPVSLPHAGMTFNGQSPSAPPFPGVPPLLVPPTRPTPVHDGRPLRHDAPSAQQAGTPRDQRGVEPRAPIAGSVLSAADLPTSVSRPVVNLETLERAGLVVARTKRTRISEEYRIVIGRVLRALHEEPEGEPGWGAVANNVVLVTSARPGEGKSFTALNLAGSIAQNAGESVLLVDVDPKIRPMSDQLGLGESLGFMDLIAQPSLSPDDFVLPTALSNLAFLPLGSRETPLGETSAVDNPSESRLIAPAIHRLAKRYPKSLIMLDAPPCLSTSDPHTLAAHVGQVVMVVEAERTQRSEVEAALDLVRVCPTITMLLNKVRLTTSHTFGAYDYFGSYT